MTRTSAPRSSGAASIVAIGGTLSGAEWYWPESNVLTSAFSPLEPIAVCAMLWSELLRARWPHGLSVSAAPSLKQWYFGGIWNLPSTCGCGLSGRPKQFGP